MNHKAIVQSLLNRFGYRVERLRPVTEDAFADQKTLLERMGVKVSTVFDLGAHIGTVTSRYRRLFPDATVHSFEPFPQSFQELMKLGKADPLVKVHNLAVADTASFQQFHSNSHEQTNSLLATGRRAGDYYDPAYLEQKEVIEVETTTLDEFCARHGVSQIEVLKMDIQGAELMALQGGKALLEKGAVSLIYAEVEFVRLYENQAVFHEICSYLAEFDYQLYNLYGLYRGFNGQLVAGDAVFLRGELFARV